MGEVLQNWVCLILFRLALPLILLIATVVRFNFFSFIYGCLMLISPLLKRPTPKSLRSHTGRFIVATLVLCSFTLLSQIIFQIYVGTGNRGIGNCSETEMILHHIGLQRLSSNMLISATIIVPDIAAFVVSLAVFICCHTMLRRRPGPHISTPPFTSSFWPARSCPTIFDYFAKFITLVFMTLAGILQPSAVSSVYFVSVLVSVTVWSVCVLLHPRWFQGLRFFLLVYTALHLIAAYVVQFHYAQTIWTEHVEHNGTFERLCGLTRFIDVDCTNDSNVVSVRLDLPWAVVVNAFVVILFYFVLAWELRRCRTKSPRQGKLKQEDVEPGLKGATDAGQDLRSEPSVSFSRIRPDSSDCGSVVITQEIEIDDAKAEQRRGVIITVGSYIRRQSYIGTLIIMMAWSIAFHSWLTFIFLLGACFIWILPQKQAVCLRCSPIIVSYAVCLLVLQYIYAFNLTDEELPIMMSNGYKFLEIGLVKYTDPSIPLGVKIGFTCMFWLTLRQFSWRRHQRKKARVTAAIPLKTMGDKGGQDGETIKAVGRWMWHKLCKYWILACAALFLLIALQEAVIFRIIYMALFLCFVITFQVSYWFWRLCIKAFWWLVILYSMVVLGCIYTYQFEGFPGLWENRTGMSEEMLSNLGLRKFDTTTLFVQLLTPTSFLIVIIMQLHYFQKTFFFISDLNRFQKKDSTSQQQDTDAEAEHCISTEDTTTDNNHDGVVRKAVVRRGDSRRRHGVVKYSWKDRFKIISIHISMKILNFTNRLSVVLWRFMEIHVFKFVVISIFLCCVLEVNVLNTVMVMMIIVLLPFERTHRAVSVISLVWSSIVLLMKMVYQLDTIPLDLMVSNCTLLPPLEYSVQVNETLNVLQPTGGPPTLQIKLAYPFNLTIDSSSFVGLQRKSHLASYVKVYIIVILMLVLEALVKYHQIQFYNHPDRKRPMQGIMFEKIKRKDADRGLKECLMFLANYTFYKFGRELCFTTTMITMVVRLDVFSVLYGLFLGFLLLLRRRSCQAVWPVYVAILTVLLLLQYLSCLGMPPAICWEYPWTSSHWAMSTNLKTYLFLPSYTYSPRSHKLIADFFQLLLVCLQWRVFYIESNEKRRDNYGGGLNTSIVREVEKGKRNPGFPGENDFTSYKNSYLDYLKMIVFFWSFWLTLMIVLISGMSRISLFCMGYLIGCFVFLWFGEEMLLKPLRRLVKMWRGLLFYCYIVLLAKCCLQLVGCIYATSVGPSLCWVIQLLNIVCLQSTYYEQPAWSKTDCQVSQDEAGLSWDAVCFVFLLFMVRVFKSWYFQHVVDELQVRNELAARGAELINQNLLDEVEQLRIQENGVVERIKWKMEKIKDRHQKCLRRKEQTVVEPDDHYLVIRSGDYYMFEDMSDEEEEDEIEGGKIRIDGQEFHLAQTDEYALETPDWRAKKPAIGPIQFINAAITGGTKGALDLAEGRSSMFSMQTSRRSSSARDYGTPDCEMPPSSPPLVTAHSHQSKELAYVGGDAPVASPNLLRRKPEPATSTPNEQSTSASSSDTRGATRMSPRRGLQAPSEGISPVAEEEVLSTGEDDVFDGKAAQAPENTKQDEKKEDAVVSGLNFIRVFAISVLDSLTAFLHNLSRNYRSISRVLESEKQQAKLRRKPATASQSLRPSENDQSGDEVDGATPAMARRPSNFAVKQKTSHRGFEAKIEELKSAEKDFHSQMPRFLRLMIAIMEALMSRTDLLCYFVMVLNVLLSASVLSILFPISIFFWGMLSVPRPTKTYWITVITYTEAIIVVKYLFQFNFFPWNMEHISNPPLFWLPRLLGIEKKEMYAALDFLLLFCLFLHRMVLKSHGLWKDARALDADLKDVELKRASVPGSPHSLQLRPTSVTELYLKVEEGSAQRRNTLPASPKPSREDICLDGGGQVTTGAGDVGDNEETTVELEEADQKEEEEPKKENRSQLFFMKLFRPVYEFFSHMVKPKYSAVSDVYAFMFACDLVTFLIVVFGYSSFGPASVEGADVATVLQQSRVPVPFLAMLLVQFVLIIIDRALYLRKLVFGKFLFHIFLVILVHIWMFFLLPAITDRAFTSNVAAQLWYFIKCVYFALSCYQIRSGYPTRILGNFLTKNYNYLNLFCFKGFLAVPFLLELRALMDWMWTDTTLALTSWLQMEDIYANIFVLKCWRRAEKKYPTPRGNPRSPVVKYGLGGLILVVLVFIIWFPLLLFSLSGSIFNANPPVVVDLEIKITGYQSIFSMNAQYGEIEKFSGRQYDDLKKLYKYNTRAQSFLMSYRDEDVYEAKIRGTSASTWEISHPSERHLHDALHANADRITLLTVISVRREPTSGRVSVQVPTVVGTFETTLNRSIPEQNQTMVTLAKMINGSYNLGVTIPNMFPRYVTVPSQKRLDESAALYSQNLSWSSVRLSLHQHPVRKTRWWQVEEYISGNMTKHDLLLGTTTDASSSSSGSAVHKHNPHLTIVTFNERVPTGVFSVLNNYGIIGIYVSVVLVLGKFVRLWTQGLMMRIMFEELPNPEPIWTLCHNIYLARELFEYELEEELVSKLLFIFRSPELLLRITYAKPVKQKQE